MNWGEANNYQDKMVACKFRSMFFTRPRCTIKLADFLTVLTNTFLPFLSTSSVIQTDTFSLNRPACKI